MRPRATECCAKLSTKICGWSFYFDGVFLSPPSWDTWGFGWVCNFFKTIKNKATENISFPFRYSPRDLPDLGAGHLLVHHSTPFRIKVAESQSLAIVSWTCVYAKTFFFINFNFFKLDTIVHYLLGLFLTAFLNQIRIHEHILLLKY